jgi:hypothetical protein
MNLVTPFRSVHDPGQDRLDGLLGGVLLHTRGVRHVIDQFSCLHSGVPVL